MASWKDVRQTIASKSLGSAAWQSDQKHLLGIIDQAQQAGIDPSAAQQCSLSNLRAIIKPARRAIKQQNWSELARLLEQAARLPNSQLRIVVGSHSVDQIRYRTIRRKSSTVHEVLLTPEQFKRIRKMTSASFTFKEIP